MNPERRQIAYVDHNYKWQFPQPRALFQNNIFAALACFYEDVPTDRGCPVSLVTTSPVERGYFPKLPQRLENDTYPYKVSHPFGCHFTQFNQFYESQAMQGGYGGQGYPSSASMPGPYSQTYPAQPYTGQNPISQPHCDTPYTVWPVNGEKVHQDPVTHVYYFFQRSTGQKIYLTPSGEPYQGQWRGPSGNQ